MRGGSNEAKILTCNYLFISSSERYNPITGTPVPVYPTRPNTSAIFGGSPGAIEYMFIPPNATTRPTTPDTTEKRRSLSRESLRRSFTTVPESKLDSDEYSSISDLSECSGEAEHRERTRTNSGSFSKTRKPITRSASSRLPVSASKPTVMKRANSFTRGTGSCVTRGQARDSRGSTNSQRESNSTSDLSTQPRRSSVGETSKIPRKGGPRGPGPQIPQSSRIPLKRADVNSNVANRERSGKETTSNKRTAPADSKTSGIPVNTSSKKTSSELKEPSEPVISKESALSGIPVKGGSKAQQHSGSSRTPFAKQGGGDPQGNVANRTTKQNQNIDKENENAMQGGKSTLKREGTGDELRVAKNDVTKSKLPRKSSIPRSNVAKTSQQKTRNISKTEVETKAAKTSQITKNKTTSLTVNKINVPSYRRETSTGPAEETSTSSTLQRSDSGYGDTDSVSSKEDAPEPGNEFTFSRENSKSKIPRMSSTSRGAAKSSRDGSTSDEKKPMADTKKAESTVADANGLIDGARGKLEKETRNNNEKDFKMAARTYEGNKVCSETDKVWVRKNETSQKSNISEKKVENVTNKTKTSSKENLVDGLRTSKDVVTSQTESRGLANKEVELGTDNGKQIRDVLDTSGSAGIQKPGIQDGGSCRNIDGLVMQRNVSCGDHKKILNDEKNKGENKDNNNVSIKLEGVFNKKQVDSTIRKQSTETLASVDNEAESKNGVQKDIKTRNDVEKQASVSSERVTSKSEKEQETVARKKQSPRKPPRLSKLLAQNESENKQELSDMRQVWSSKEGNLNKDVISGGNAAVEKPGDTRHARSFGMSDGVRLPQDVGQVREVGVVDKVYPSTTQEVSLVGGLVEKTGGVGEPDVDQTEEVGQLEEEGVEDKEDPPRRSDNCMQCRMEQSMLDGEDIPKDDPGFRQYPTFISPRKSLIMCKHHAKQKDDMDMPREQPELAMTSTPNTNNQKLNLETLQQKREPTAKILSLSSVLNNTERLGNTSRNSSNHSESLKTPKNVVNESRQVESKILPGPKGTHSPLLALSRDKKFAQNTKTTEDIKTALSLEWDDTGTELSPPNFSDEDEEPGGTSGDLGDNRRPSVKLMNTNEALDKLKVIQSLIMKEAESRSRKEPEENAGKHAVGSKKTGNELVESTGKYSKNPGNKVGNLGGRDSSSNQVSPTSENAGRKASSPTIWDRITDNSTISQDQTTELLNETLAKLKASPKLSSNALARRTLSSRSLPGSRHASKEQLLSDGERPVYVYTSSWMNTSGKNSRGSLLSLCSNNRSLPSSRQNLTKEPGLKRSESAAGRMEKENGKRLEPKERKEYRLSNFDEINLSDDMSELRSQKATTPHQTPAVDKNMDGEKPRKKSKRSKKKSKNTAATTNNLPAYGVSMEDLAEGKTKCQCGGNRCVIS